MTSLFISTPRTRTVVVLLELRLFDVPFEILGDAFGGTLKIALFRVVRKHELYFYRSSCPALDDHSGLASAKLILILAPCSHSTSISEWVTEVYTRLARRPK